MSERVVVSRAGSPILQAHDAWSFRRRLQGLHAVPPLSPEDALIIRPCKAIHTIGLAQAIDVMFLDRDGVILKLASVAPRRAMICWNAHLVVEMLLGTIDRLELRAGQQCTPNQGWWS